MDYINTYLDLLDEKSKDCDVCKTVSEKTKLRRAYILLLCAVLCVVVCVLVFGIPFVANLVGFIYPAYYSILSIKSSNKDDDTKWLVYWVTFGFFAILESILKLISKLNFFFYIVKIAFFVCCFVPEIDLANLIYKSAIMPFLKKHEMTIDEKLNVVKEEVVKAKAVIDEELMKKSEEIEKQMEEKTEEEKKED